MAPREVVILDAVRTPVGRYGGALAHLRPDDLAAATVRSVVDRAPFEADTVDEIVLGAANQAGEDNRNVARMAALLAGLSDVHARTHRQSSVRQRPRRHDRRVAAASPWARPTSSWPVASSR